MVVRADPARQQGPGLGGCRHHAESVVSRPVEAADGSGCRPASAQRRSVQHIGGHVFRTDPDPPRRVAEGAGGRLHHPQRHDGRAAGGDLCRCDQELCRAAGGGPGTDQGHVGLRGDRHGSATRPDHRIAAGRLGRRRRRHLPRPPPYPPLDAHDRGNGASVPRRYRDRDPGSRAARRGRRHRPRRRRLQAQHGRNREITGRTGVGEGGSGADTARDDAGAVGSVRAEHRRDRDRRRRCGKRHAGDRRDHVENGGDGIQPGALGVRRIGAGVAKRADSGNRNRGVACLHQRDWRPGRPVRPDRHRRVGAGTAHQRNRERACRFGWPYQRGGPADRNHRRSDEPARAQRNDRGGACRGTRQGLRGRGQRGEVAGQPDRDGNRGHSFANSGHSACERRLGGCDPRHCLDGGRADGDRRHHRIGCRRAKCGRSRNRIQCCPGGAGNQ